jgi:hypothetical protein
MCAPPWGIGHAPIEPTARSKEAGYLRSGSLMDDAVPRADACRRSA